MTSLKRFAFSKYCFDIIKYSILHITVEMHIHPYIIQAYMQASKYRYVRRQEHVQATCTIVQLYMVSLLGRAVFVRYLVVVGSVIIQKSSYSDSRALQQQPGIVPGNSLQHSWNINSLQLMYPVQWHAVSFNDGFFVLSWYRSGSCCFLLFPFIPTPHKLHFLSIFL